MQRFDIRETQEIAARGRYLRWDTDSGRPINVRAAGVDLGPLFPGELLELPEPVDKWMVTPQPGETGFVRVGFDRVDSDRKSPQSRPPVLIMETGAGQVAAGAGPGWVSGNPAGLPAATSLEICFDLGSEWAQYTVAQVLVYVAGPSSGFSAVQVYGGDTTANLGARRLPPAYATNFGTTYQTVPSTGMQGVCVRPVGRYVFVTVYNQDASNAAGASSRITLAAYPA